MLQKLLAIVVFMVPFNVSAGLIVPTAGNSFFFGEYYSSYNGVGDITGYGTVTTIRDSGGSVVYQASAADEITYEIGASRTSSSLDGGVVRSEYDNTFMNFFYDDTVNFNPVTGTGFDDGLSLLNLTGHDYVSAKTGDVINLIDLLILGLSNNTGFLSTFLDVDAGGAGIWNSTYDTNSINVAGSVSQADFDFDASHSTLESSIFEADNSGTGDLRGFAQAPEPLTIAMIGIGLVGIGATRKVSA